MTKSGEKKLTYVKIHPNSKLFLDGLVRSGKYNTISEAVCSGLIFMKEQVDCSGPTKLPSPHEDRDTIDIVFEVGIDPDIKSFIDKLVRDGNTYCEVVHAGILWIASKEEEPRVIVDFPPCPLINEHDPFIILDAGPTLNWTEIKNSEKKLTS